ncbi:MAG: hypothetical protein OJF55_001934 [Rhodanobacteraceae bacterium]|nr:MAG: hypothetical protein OJF55_001934 [Rhodanobacteraceae bacterium]
MQPSAQGQPPGVRNARCQPCQTVGTGPAPSQCAQQHVARAGSKPARGYRFRCLAIHAGKCTNAHRMVS